MVETDVVVGIGAGLVRVDLANKTVMYKKLVVGMRAICGEDLFTRSFKNESVIF